MRPADAVLSGTLRSDPTRLRIRTREGERRKRKALQSSTPRERAARGLGVTPAELARLRADLAEARRRRDEIDYRWAVAKHTSSGTDNLDDLDVEVLGAAAEVAEIEERLALAEGAAPAPPAPAQRAAVDLAAPPANDARAPAAPPELLTAREAAAFLRLSVDTLERMRQRPGAGPPFKRVGHRVLYPIAGLRDYGNRK